MTLMLLFEPEASMLVLQSATYAEAKKSQDSVLAGDGELLQYLTLQLFRTN